MYLRHAPEGDMNFDVVVVRSVRLVGRDMIAEACQLLGEWPTILVSAVDIAMFLPRPIPKRSISQYPPTERGSSEDMASSSRKVLCTVEPQVDLGRCVLND